VGFTSVDVTDITNDGWNRFARFELSHCHESWLKGQVDFSELQSRCSFVYVGAAVYSHNVLCFATK
jgi:hypothetical protein